MKVYRSVILFLLLFALTVSLSGCIVIPLFKFYNFSADEVSTIQIYDLREQNKYSIEETLDPIYTIPENAKKDFLNDFSKLKFTDTLIIVIAAVDPSFSYGDWVIRINFTDGRYAFYSCGGYGAEYDADGNRISSTHFSCDDEELVNLIGKYYEIPQSSQTGQISVESFSYESDCAYYKNDPGVKESGFVNTKQSDVANAVKAVDLAKKECTVEYDAVSVAFDSELKIYRVSFYKENQLGGNQDVYINQNGITQLIIYGE